MEARWANQGYIHFKSNHTYGLLLFAVKDSLKDIVYMYLGNDIVYIYEGTTIAGNLTIHGTFCNNSGDRIKENEELIAHACETLSRLRPQLYDKKPEMENNDPTTWYEESGLIAQEIYYDAPESRHLVHRGSPETDEEGNSIPLPEITTSIDPQQDHDYSSWGKDPASVNYIGLIAYLVKANTE